MDFKVIERPMLDVAAWEKLSARASFFQTIAWADICSDAMGSRARPVFICGFKDRRLRAGMPAIVTSRFGLASLYSMPYDTYGGIIFDDRISAEDKDDFYTGMVAYLRKDLYSRIVITDFSASLAGCEKRCDLHVRTALTHVIPLSSDRTYEPPDKKTRGHVRRGKKEGAEIVTIDSEEYLDEFFNLYCLTEKRHGRETPRYDRHFFDTLLLRLADSNTLLWLGVIADGEMIGSQINFIHADTLFNWQTVSDYDKRRFKPNHLLLDYAIDVARERTLSRVNLGASPEDAEGLIDYKDRWGGRQVEYDIYYYRSGLRKLLGR